jgi:hypothetical protein
MLTATRDDGPHAHAVHYGPHTPPRSLAARFTGAIQLVGSLVGIPLALIGGYSTYHATFSPEGRCQALRANIVSMLDKKTDATTLRLLVQKDVVTFEQECGAVDADAATAFKNLLASEKAPAVAHRVAPPAKIEKAEKVEAVMAQPPAKAEKVEKHEPVKREAVKRDVPAKEVVSRETANKEVAVKEAPAKEAIIKLEPPKQQLGAPPQPLVVPPVAAEKVAAPPPVAEKATPPQAEQQVEKANVQSKPVETAPAEAESVAAPLEKANVDATWVASVREALRESASQPAAAETTSEGAPRLGAPIDISPEPQTASEAPERRSEFAPPGGVGPGGSRPQAPRPPAPIPNAN